MATRIKARTGKLYETDFFLWTKEQAAALRAGRLDALDRDNLAEEVESLGRKDRRELESRLTVLVMHLLKWRYQPAERGGSWDSTIRTERREIQKLLHDSPKSASRPLRSARGRLRHRSSQRIGGDPACA